MPDTLIEWAMFLFFTGGAAGGWIVMALVAHDFMRRFF
jgi:Ni/Fe-hydrogenase subunit HybB-like protein